MGLDFSKPAMTTVTATAGQTDKNEIAVVEQYDIVADRQQMNQELVNSEEVDRIVSTIEIHNLDTIVSFGAEVADEISKASDVVLNSMNMSQLDETSEMMKALAKIMEQFDIDEIKDNPGLFGKLFGNLKKQLDKILAKYHTMGEEVDKIYVQLKGYESEIKQSNRKLSTMFDANVNYYHELVKYILAGEQACKEIEAYIAQRQQDMESTGDQSIQFELTALNQALLMMEQRTQDLRTAENVAMQSIPMIKTMEFSNYNLVRKINSAFIITLPVFKQALAQAILLNRRFRQNLWQLLIRRQMRCLLRMLRTIWKFLSRQLNLLLAAQFRLRLLKQHGEQLLPVLKRLGELKRMLERNAKRIRLDLRLSSRISRSSIICHLQKSSM